MKISRPVLGIIQFLTLVVMLGAVSLPCPVWAADSDTFSTGKEWLEATSLRHKIIALIAPSVLFHKYNVPMQKTIGDYVSTIDRVLLENPYLEKEDVANIFASTLYAYEPQSRPALDWMQMEFARRKMNYEDGAIPHLIVIKRPADDPDQAR